MSTDDRPWLGAFSCYYSADREVGEEYIAGDIFKQDLEPVKKQLFN
jgi:hypothetical protein